jgi:hypothetical protein
LRGWKRQGHWLVLAVLAAGLAACSDGSGSLSLSKTPEPAVDPTMYPREYKTEVAGFMRTYLNNPRKVRDAYIAEPVLRPVAGVQQYITCVRYNPQDTSNVYQGNQTDLAIFLGGQVNQFGAGDPKLCAGLNYQRFPEIENMVP